MKEPGNNKTIVIIAGPTAVGKTAVAIAIARHFSSEIISADSRQCYREMNIGVARPSPKELSAIPHHFVATHSIFDEVTAATFENYALEKSGELFKRMDLVIMEGGTGLYLKAFCEGLDDIPGVAPGIRDAILRKYQEEGITWLREEIKKRDPVFFKEGESKNPQRMMRALEVVQSTGQSILDFHKGVKKKRPFNFIKIGLELSREDLQERINHRVDKMIESGLVDEVKGLMSYKHVNALQTVGYIEIRDYLENKISLAEATDLVKIHTRQYAKRQMTWFKKDKEIFWFAPNEIDSIVSRINEYR